MWRTARGLWRSRSSPDQARRPASDDRHARCGVCLALHTCNEFLGALAGSGGRAIEIIRRSDQAKGFQVIQRRWAVERTLAWLIPAPRQGPGNYHRIFYGMDNYSFHTHACPQNCKVLLRLKEILTWELIQKMLFFARFVNFCFCTVKYLEKAHWV